MATIEHVCLACADIEKEKAFYCRYFGLTSNEKYHNAKTGWENYFLSSPEGGARLELLAHSGITALAKEELAPGFAHIAFALGSEKAVDLLAERLAQDGFSLLSRPRRTGDGYYEASFLDPEGNKVEITV